ncbi:hypothetical protein, partial [Alistipes shahii]|uniref:hypothetical protein n=1 Tax=Alistipes shahii TaxID=328814 RepID=UPI00307C9F87
MSGASWTNPGRSSGGFGPLSGSILFPVFPRERTAAAASAAGSMVRHAANQKTFCTLQKVFGGNRRRGIRPAAVLPVSVPGLFVVGVGVGFEQFFLHVGGNLLVAAEF